MPLSVALKRVGYRAAHRALRLYWFLFRPKVVGVKCLLTNGELVLLVRHTYGDRRWDLPGGTVKRGEEPATAARREIEEELGVSIQNWDWLGELHTRNSYRNDELHCFRAELPARRLTLDLGELQTAEWFPRRRLPAALTRYVRPILARAWTD
jgi:8-oxo-dGTP diphosphatase